MSIWTSRCDRCMNLLEDCDCIDYQDVAEKLREYATKLESGHFFGLRMTEQQLWAERERIGITPEMMRGPDNDTPKPEEGEPFSWGQ